MYCPKCGAPREEGDRFCPVCGADLSDDGARDQAPESLRSRAASLIGTTRKARLLTVGTVIALIVAVIAFLALKSDESETEVVIPRDGYTIAAEQLCIKAKREIASSERSSVAAAETETPGTFARALVPIVNRWRTEFGAMEAPPGRAELAESLATDLRRVEVEIAALARVAEEGDQAATVERAKRVDESTSEVEAAVAALGLSRCARLTLGVAPAASG